MRNRPAVVAASVLLAVAVFVALVLSAGDARPRRTEAGPAPATAHAISVASDLIDGPLARGQIGDYLLANSEIQVVIQRPLRNLLSVGEFGGQIIDADLVRVGPDPERDNFEEWAVGVNLENTCHYTSVTVINDGTDSNPAVIRASGVDDLLNFINPSSQVAGFGGGAFSLPPGFDDVDLPVTCATDYTLAPNAKHVQVDTTFTNTGTSQIDTFITEFMNGSGQVEIFQQGYGFGQPLIATPCPRCNMVVWNGIGAATGVAYGYIHDIPGTTVFSTAGVTIPVLGTNAALALIGAAPPNYIIPANNAKSALPATSPSPTTPVRSSTRATRSWAIRQAPSAAPSPAIRAARRSRERTWSSWAPRPTTWRTSSSTCRLAAPIRLTSSMAGST